MTLALPLDLMRAKRQQMAEELYQNVYDAMVKSASKPEVAYALSGRLYIADSGWLLLSVPNAVVRGLFDALAEPGIELPVRPNGSLNAHVSVLTPEEVKQIGGPEKITERGHSFKYTLGAVKCVKPRNYDGISKVWYVAVNSPELQAVRKSYGLSPMPNDNKHEFHITIAVRKVKVLHDGPISKTEPVGVK